jgi:rRNA maturation endonuclease Nob1
MREILEGLYKCWACGFVFHMRGQNKCHRCGAPIKHGKGEEDDD